MTENIPQTSASERIEQAQKVLAEFRNATPENGKNDIDRYRLALEMADRLEALITPPGVHDSERSLARDLITKTPAHVSGQGIRFQYDDLMEMLMSAIRAGIQYAHERWEPADHPSQEMMLRWLGITHEESVREHEAWFIPEQYIEKEVD
ncbi:MULTISPECIES: hypothetical protein [unclassified Microbacterium]|uniref:hypothetical protein n=1 Tax=unclassified Microbacterium TaxID=2609290 RepID=UPI000EAA2DF2|nr:MULTISPECIES: hypothetical protein [unclassified Microbacterium]MBT2484803.1 hypothetical protein [Microbacterium sp. ISL-108]RKN67676.1 hypothetical protein D7252_08815 [Microbacterium sp. CGR2]